MATQNGNPGGFKKLADSVGNLVGAAGTVASAGAKATAGTAQGGAGMAGRAASGSAGLVGTVINTVANTARRFPKISFLIGTYAAIKGIQSVVRKGKEKKEAAMQAEAAPQQMNAAQPSYSPQSFEGQSRDAAAASMSPEQAAFLREMQQGQQAAAPAPQAGEGKWATQIAQERQQQAGLSQQQR